MEWEIFSYSESLEMRRPHCPPGDVLNPFLQLISPGMHTVANGLRSRLEDVGLVDPQVAFTLLRLCGGFLSAHPSGPVPHLPCSQHNSSSYIEVKSFLFFFSSNPSEEAVGYSGWPINQLVSQSSITDRAQLPF